MPTLTLADVDQIAAEAHAGQVDKIGVPYIEHVRAVSRGLEPFGTGLAMAGLLHDTLEDTELRARDLVKAGVPAGVIKVVIKVTNQPGVAYEEKLRSIVWDYAATLLKLSDNAHNSLAERAAQLPEEKRERLAAKYANARSVLLPALAAPDVLLVLGRVNPALAAQYAGQLALTEA